MSRCYTRCKHYRNSTFKSIVIECGCKKKEKKKKEKNWASFNEVKMKLRKCEVQERRDPHPNILNYLWLLRECIFALIIAFINSIMIKEKLEDFKCTYKDINRTFML